MLSPLPACGRVALLACWPSTPIRGAGADLLPDKRVGARWPLARRPYLMETSIPGVFCVGDARSTSVSGYCGRGRGSICVQLLHRALQEP
jgi:thioredoxin reductase (NADPH)